MDDDVFYICSKLVPSSIDINNELNDDDPTSEVVAYLRSPDRIKQEKKDNRTKRMQQRQTKRKNTLAKK
ncbi:hypothetical protein TL16_g07232 [Triparma laevis f. inornata]|uniref:Uncharacterized protein n=1 Tax=Triparma laevis f. inornata TaxID=1714386 RepID=A0A9W7AXM8_9STRA|nr:hypothetical protein TL16_g07232 [Triparma laevis f. inornata]